MHFERHSWYSPRLGRVMPLAIYGHAGAPVIVFPTSGGSLYEAYDFGMRGYYLFGGEPLFRKDIEVDGLWIVQRHVHALGREDL